MATTAGAPTARAAAAPQRSARGQPAGAQLPFTASAAKARKKLRKGPEGGVAGAQSGSAAAMAAGTRRAASAA
jgi:hypothetical protein